MCDKINEEICQFTTLNNAPANFLRARFVDAAYGRALKAGPGQDAACRSGLFRADAQHHCRFLKADVFYLDLFLFRREFRLRFHKETIIFGYDPGYFGDGDENGRIALRVG